MAKLNYQRLEAERQKITEHFKKEKKKAWISFIVTEIILLSVAFIVCYLAAKEQFYIYFFISLLFTLVFPITQFSKKMKDLTRLQKEQLGFAEQDY